MSFPPGEEEAEDNEGLEKGEKKLNPPQQNLLSVITGFLERPWEMGYFGYLFSLARVNALSAAVSECPTRTIQTRTCTDRFKEAG
ncbi:hypothetical protein RUM44_008859 [Polyplax serrata]|uniref:Uncharacterized protein n=1 Tax=Polyplax serrata TaxID=468196 RepID=A0ABR1BBN7_POLSC